MHNSIPIFWLYIDIFWLRFFLCLFSLRYSGCTFRYSGCTFSNAKFHSYILAVYSYHLHQFLVLFHFRQLLFLLCEIFTPALADSSSLKYGWQHVFSRFQDSSQYPGRSQLCCSLDDIHLSSYFQVFQSLYQSFSHCTKSTNYNWYHFHFHVTQFFFQFPNKVEVLILLFALF